MPGQHSDQKSLPQGVPFEDYKPPNWDEFFMLKVYLTGRTKRTVRVANGIGLV
jgi:hypothetical protein